MGHAGGNMLSFHEMRRRSPAQRAATTMPQDMPSKTEVSDGAVVTAALRNQLSG